jgi:hypothetical protein
MFNRKPKAIVPYPNNNNKIKPSSTPTPLKGPNTNSNTYTEILGQMRNTQQITNAEYSPTQGDIIKTS